jgi:DNA helicase HerA-like ATPase
MAMPVIELFPRNQIAGIFRGFQEGGLEFHADLVLPYRHEFQNIPMHGQFLLVQLETPDEAVLGRIASFSSEGKLASSYGEEFNIRALRENRPVPDDLREDYLKYRVNIRVLGVLRKGAGEKLQFVPSHRRLPHVGSPVAFPSGEVLRAIVGHTGEGAVIGHFALGEYIYSEGCDRSQVEEWMQIKSPEILVRFPVKQLVSRRSFIFARAGFGKSNLNKLLFSTLYTQTPMVTKRGDKRVPVGTIIFDPDGEYFWPDDKGRPGLCDVPVLQDKLVVFTSRKGPSPFYDSFVAGDIKLDIRRLNPSDVIAIALGPERQEQQNVRKLKGLDQRSWEGLVNLIDQYGNQAPLDEIGRILGLESNKQELEALAARGNMTAIVRTLHDKSSQLMDMLIYALSRGKLCVVDVSRMRGPQALILSGLILRRIFDRNQEEFTKAEPKTIPTIAVVEEAQSVLNERATASEPYIAWVKEGRKYDLGALLITQQPGSIPVDILSQGDNWFIFHLLSAADLTTLQKANAHFSSDILSVLLNEPIPGQGVFWSSVGGTPYPVSLRVLSFERMYAMLDAKYSRPAVETFAQQLKAEFQQALEERLEAVSTPLPSLEIGASNGNSLEAESIDTMSVYKKRAIEALRRKEEFLEKMRRGVPWGVVKGYIADELPKAIEEQERGEIAYNLVPEALETIFGPENEQWYKYTASRKDGKPTMWVKAGNQNNRTSSS